MFLVEQNVPDVYVHESRDFQLFSRLYDIVFQSSRFSIDSMELVSDTMRCNEALLPLIATKVGFFTDLKIADNAFRAILSAFPHIVKYKGSIKGIDLSVQLLGRLMNTNISIEYDKKDRSHITIVFDESIDSVALLQELITYIRPTGLMIDYTARKDTYVTSDYGVGVSVTIADTQCYKREVPPYTEGTKTDPVIGFVQVYDINPDVVSLEDHNVCD